MSVTPRLLLLCAALAVLPARAPAAAPLFASDQPLDVSLTADFPSLCRPRETEDCEFTPSRLEYRDESGQRRSIPVRIKIRGGWRSKPDGRPSTTTPCGGFRHTSAVG